MSILLVGPNRPMAVKSGLLALYLPSAVTVPTTTSPSLSLTQAAPNAFGWWDSSSPGGMLGINNIPSSTWNAPGHGLLDLSGNGQTLQPFLSPNTGSYAVAVPHLSGLLGGAGFPISAPDLLQPALDAGAGWQIPNSQSSSSLGWTFFLVWSRPNWRQGTAADALPVTLLATGSQPILQVDSSGGSNRLILFPGLHQTVISSNMDRRHTHSVVIRYSSVTGVSIWLDAQQIVHGVAGALAAPIAPTYILHDGTPFGAAQCWLHEAASWQRTLSDVEAAAVANYAGRWFRGKRKGLYLLVNGQSNAINYAMNDGAATLLARSLSWYLGALAYNVLATTGSATSYTMQSGHGIYDVASAGYPGSFLNDPGDGSDPSGWSLGADGQALQQAINGLSAADTADISAIIWPWNETDSLRGFGEYNSFRSAALRFLSLLRTQLGDSSNKIPLVWWNAIPYGSADGVTMHREVVADIAANVSNNVVIGNRQTTDSNARGSIWDPTTGVAIGGDSAHRDSADNLRFARLASPVIARALVAGGYGDSIAALPDFLPHVGGPTIIHVFRQSATRLVVTVFHDGANDLKVPLLASTGIGFAVMDGGSPGNSGLIVPAIACLRLDPTHLQIDLMQPLQNSSGMCRLFYPYGPAQIGRGNAVTDNFSAIPAAVGWDAVSDLGTDWRLDYPLAGTTSGVILSDAPS